jgi:MFS transporter, AAHS family, 4-hydroxybenzoate transporter
VLPLIAIPLLLLIGLLPLSPHAFLILSICAASVVGGEQFGILSIAGIYYNSAIRANGGGWATSVAKVGGITGPIIGGYVLSSGLPIVRSFAILAICPVILALCAAGIGVIVRRRRPRVPAHGPRDARQGFDATMVRPDPEVSA